ncbi:MAG: flagellar protein FlaG [Gammaproteobacteria bacterium]|nr:flagellar protein FlaG [Gammaproteobacteria bacterium]
MVSDIGMIKAVVPQMTQASPAASANPPEQEVQAKVVVDRVRQQDQQEKESEPLEEVVSDLNNLVRELHRELQFSVDEDSGETVIKVIDKETDEIVRQIPSEEIMELRRRLQQATGVIFRDSA